MKNLSIVIATYNEKGNIEKLLDKIIKDVIPKIEKDYKTSIVIADDNSTDGTDEIVKKYKKKHKFIHLSQGPKKGLGAAYLRADPYAIEKLKADIICHIDGDDQHDPKAIPSFLKELEKGNDMVLGTRYSHGGSIPSNWPLQRKAFSIFGNLLVRTILMRFALHDWTGGYRVFKKEVFEKEQKKLKSVKGYTFQTSFTHKALQDKFKISEVPIHFSDRKLGDSKIAPMEYIFDLLKYIFTARFFEMLHSPFPKYGITGLIGYIINASTLELLTQGAGINSGLSAAIGAELSIVWNFTINNVWSFKAHSIKSKGSLLSKFLQFNLVSAGSLVIIGSFVWLATHAFGNTPLVRQISLIIVIGLFIVPYSYTMYNIFIWKRWRVPFLSKLQDRI